MVEKESRLAEIASSWMARNHLKTFPPLNGVDLLAAERAVRDIEPENASDFLKGFRLGLYWGARRVEAGVEEKEK